MFSILIRKGRKRTLELTGKEPKTLFLPLTHDCLAWCQANSSNSLTLQIALENFTGQISIHFPSHKLLSFCTEIELVCQPMCPHVPVDGKTFFTDGSGRTGKAVIVCYDNDSWQCQVYETTGSPQILELYAVLQVFRQWQEPLNLVTDSQYVANVVM